MIYLFTDFGYSGPYVGELHAVFKRQFPDRPLIDLMHDAPTFNPRASSYLLGALCSQFVQGDLCLGVVDPGVGLESRRALLIEADGVIYCGPDNGLFSQVVRCANKVSCYEITWRPAVLSDSFHGRDLFAQALVRYVSGIDLTMHKLERSHIAGINWPTDTPSIIYFDQFGNAITGIRACTIQINTELEVNNILISYARTFAQVAVGQIFWYINSMGLVELAINQGSVREKLAISIGTQVSVAKKSG